MKRNAESDASSHITPLQFKKPDVQPSKKLKDNEERITRSYGATTGLNAFDRHKLYINNYVLFYNRGKDITENSTDWSKYKSDKDILRENYKFIRTLDDDDESTWENRMAKKYYEKLFKEYCLADLSRYKEGKVGLRWRTQEEVFRGKGQFICGNKKCDEREDLKSYEVNFAYLESGEKKNALVKLRVCPDCAFKVNYKSIQKARKQEKKERDKKKKKDKDEQDEDDVDEEYEKRRFKEEHQKEAKRAAEEAAVAEKKRQELAEAWKQKPEMEKTKEEEYDEYFSGLFL